MQKKYFKGLKFGMLLQLAVGPMCLMVFNTAQISGFFVAMSLVIAIAIVDALYITLASLGISRILNKPKVKKIFSLIGAIVLALFGINMILNVFGINIIPGLNITPDSKSIFVQGLILTLSNPITIVFWGSVLTTKIIEDKMNKKDLIIFSTGLVSATLLFLTIIAILGTVLSHFIPVSVSNVLNICVGIIIIFFGLKMLIKKENKDKKQQ